MNNTISARDADNYRDKGYLIIENALSQQVVDDLCNEATEVCLGKRGEIAGAEEFEGLDVAGLLKKIIAIHFPHKLSGGLRDMLFNPVITDTLTQSSQCFLSNMQVVRGRPGIRMRLSFPPVTAA
jgi:hypothetical protein